MVDAANDNDPNFWQSIGWQAVLIANRLRCAQQIRDKHHDAERGSDGAEEQHTEQHGADIDGGLLQEDGGQLGRPKRGRLVFAPR